MPLRRWYTVIDTGSPSRSYAGVIVGLDWTDAMGTAGRILGYPDEAFDRIEIYECDAVGTAIFGGDRIVIEQSARHA